MGKKALSGRDNWQNIGGKKASVAEQNLYQVFKQHFKGTEYKLHEKPKHLKKLYSSVKLPKDVIAQIYNPSISLADTKWGVSPDFASFLEKLNVKMVGLKIQILVLVVVMLMNDYVSYLLLGY